MTATASLGPVRVRFAPSPTGFLHVGGARTAIYNELLRRACGGAFILRIEDTDRERSDDAMTRQIQDALAWLGLEWDEGPFLQSERISHHREQVHRLMAEGKAYRCFATSEELDAARREAEQQGAAFLYPGTWRDADPAEVERRLAAGEPFAVRLKMPGGPVTFKDLVRGDMEFPPEVLDDYVLLRSDGTPTYHLSVCVDDVDMGITHVIRGEDHLSNTPKHVALFQALGSAVPMFAHLPLILGQDRKRLSKRFGATSVEEFRAQGILAPALYNYLALLGWSPGEDRELMTRDEMAALFTPERLNDSPAVFDPTKLLWMNAQYLTRLSPEQLVQAVQPFALELGLADVDPARLATAVELHRVRAQTLRELAEALPMYFQDHLEYDPALVQKYREDPAVLALVAELAARYAALAEFTVTALDEALRTLARERGVKAGVLIHPLRFAVSAQTGGPGVFDLVALVGREASARRLERFLGQVTD